MSKHPNEIRWSAARNGYQPALRFNADGRKHVVRYGSIRRIYHDDGVLVLECQSVTYHFETEQAQAFVIEQLAGNFEIEGI